MKINSKIKNFLNEASKHDYYWFEKAKISFAVMLDDRRKKSEMSYKDIAEKLDTSSAYMTKVFRGDANLTIESMVKLARATGGQLHIEIKDESAQRSVWDTESIRHNTGHRRHATSIGGTVSRVNFSAANNPIIQEPMAA